MIINGDCLKVLKTLDDESIHCCVTSPPYYALRDYGVSGQIGQEETPEQYIDQLVAVFREVKRVLKKNGTLWVNIGDSYSGSGKGAAYYPNNADNFKQGTNWGGIDKPKLRSTNKLPGYKPKKLIGIPWMLAFALREDGWYLRQDIIWYKPNPMPESVKDRCTKSHEYIFLLTKSKNYYFDAEAIAEPVAESTTVRLNQDIEKQVGSDLPGKDNGKMKAAAPRYGGKKYTQDSKVFNRTKSGNIYEYQPKRNKRDVWIVSTKPYKGAHFATYPPELIEPCVLSGCPEGGTVLDPFGGSGTTGEVAIKYNRDFILIELNRAYCDLIKERMSKVQLSFKHKL